MPLTKKVKGGVLLYALLMSAVFILLLQFYLSRVLATQRQNQAQILSAKAYLIAQLTLDEVDEKSGALTFDQGISAWTRDNDKVIVSVSLANGMSYQYNCFKKDNKSKIINEAEEKADKQEERTVLLVEESETGFSETDEEEVEEQIKTGDD